MDSILKAIEALQRTPVPNLLIILGGVFLLLAFVGRIGATIEMPPGRQKLAGLVGALFLIAGIAVSLPITSVTPSSKEPQIERQPKDPQIERQPKDPQIARERVRNGPKSPSTGSDSGIPASGVEVKVGPLVYKILSMQLDRSIPGKFSLSFNIRLTNRGGSDAHFGHDYFRLFVDDVPRAPERDPRLNEVVASNSAKEGTIRFVVPDTVTDVKLQINNRGVKSDEWPLIPINLRAAKP